jgi:uncharacterized protein YqgV (UPF0045/DUF77 family)
MIFRKEATMYVGAQISLYPLAQADLAPGIQDIWDALEEADLDQQPGPMSTLAFGEDEAILQSLQEGFRRAAERGPAVLVITLTNACPMPEK